MLLEGLFLPLTTPFLPDGRLNLPKLRENVTRYSKTPAAGLVALSRSGQPSLLSDAETRDALRCVADAAIAEKVLIAGIARDSVMHALELIAFAAESGYDAALVPSPRTLCRRAADKEALNYFETIADSAALPVVLDSGFGNDTIPTDVAMRAARHGNIIGIVDASADAQRLAVLQSGTSEARRNVLVTSVFAAVTGRMIAKYNPVGATLLSLDSLAGGGTAVGVAQAPASALKTRTKAVSFQVLCSRASAILDALGTGATGAVPPLSASAPQACYEVLAAWKDGDAALAAEKQERIKLAALVVEENLGLAGIKYGCDLNGYFGGRPRLPSLPLSGAEREQVEAAMAGLRN
jgi:dihydrodipicolinate synthase/N-acetylneuraminate lyase